MHNKIDSQQFLEYLKSGLDSEVQVFFNILNERLDLLIFSGVIRDYFLEHSGPLRDLDLVVRNDFKELENILYSIQDLNYTKNRFGGYKIKINELTIDIWDIKSTWALTEARMNQSFFIEYSLIESCFFNFSSIIFEMKSKKFIGSKYFSNFLKEKTLDIVLSNNPFPELCIVNTFYYKSKYKLKISKYLKSYIAENFFEIDHFKFDNIQEKHFNEILYSYKELQTEVYKLRDELAMH
ncbi:hypothetical protein SF1_21700 [Sphingobacterium faecium NBRC 15299]|uniref:hypothetical protein n=1 Tax=Sphingobacterium faecium TaxID=34087 RepID=UPI000D3A132B|nr:hypothetical protein [Sphingobacterium faecium]PTX14108.1 hypothetical protein C8N37_101867 [Sphingobacterium faecium]GEM64188.1 hypothetical protein SF1_21700 [Sphingobacterium faecium NBRC 15299]